MKKKNISTRIMVEMALLFAVMLLLHWTKLGYLPIGPIFATTMHIPVIIGAVYRGAWVGAILGLGFGLTSWFQALQGTSGPTAFLFMNPLISIFPRVLMGAATGWIAEMFRGRSEKKIFQFSIVFWLIVSMAMACYVLFCIVKQTGVFSAVILFLFVLATAGAVLFYDKGRNISISFSAAIGSLINTVFVMGLIYIIYAQRYMEAIGLNADQALGTVASVCLMNGVPEIILAVVIVTPVGVALKKRGKIE